LDGSKGTKLIRVSMKMYNWLNNHGTVNESFNDVIERLVKAYEERRLPYASQRRQVP